MFVSTAIIFMGSLEFYDTVFKTSKQAQRLTFSCVERLDRAYSVIPDFFLNSNSNNCQLWQILLVCLVLSICRFIIMSAVALWLYTFVNCPFYC